MVPLALVAPSSFLREKIEATRRETGQSLVVRSCSCEEKRSKQPDEGDGAGGGGVCGGTRISTYVMGRVKKNGPVTGLCCVLLCRFHWGGGVVVPRASFQSL